MVNILKPPCDEAVIQATPCLSPCRKSVGRWILLATILGSSMAFVDGTVVNVALPIFQEELNATVTDVQWIVEIYTLLLAAMLLLGGAMGDHFGRRRVFAMGIMIFALSSVWCGLVPNVEQLIIARAFQGLGGALLVPGSLAIISAFFTDESRGHAIGTWSGFTAITMALGPVLGGWLIENVSWRWIFFINIPLAAVVLLVLFFRVPESRDEGRSHGLDYVGAGLAAMGLGGIIYGFIEAANLGLTHPIVLLSLILGGVTFSAFIMVEAKSKQAMMPLTLFKSHDFSGANLLTFFLYAALTAVLFFLPFNLIQVQGYSATEAGAAFLPLILIISFLSRWAGGLIKRYGAKLPLVVGPIIAGIGYLLFAVPGIAGSYWTSFFPAMVILGLGMAISIAPLTTTVMNSVEIRYSGIASGINNAVSRLAGLLAIALLGLFVFISFTHDLNRRMARLNVPSTLQRSITVQTIKLAAIDIPESASATQSATIKTAIAESFVSSFQKISTIGAILAMLSALSAYLMIGNKPSQVSEPLA